MKNKAKPPKSMVAIAASMGISRSTLYAWKEAGAPIDKGEGAILEWAMQENRRGSDTDEMRAAKLGVLRETERRLKIANDEKSKDILKREDVQREASRTMALLWQTLDRAFGYELPPQLVNRADPAEIATMLEAQLNKFKEVLRLEFRKLDGEAVPDSEYEAVKISAEATAVLAACTAKAWETKIDYEYKAFVEWRRQQQEDLKRRRHAWLTEAAATGKAVPNATAEELVKYPGLKRTDAPANPNR
jgi:hypothetical protein